MTRNRGGRWTIQSLLATIALLSVFGSRTPARQAAVAQKLLTERLGFSQSDFVSIDRGRPVARSLSSDDRRQIATAGAVKIAVPVAFFLSRFSDIVAFKQSPLVRQIGKFSDVPRLEELDRLTLDASDVDALKKCRVGDCDIQLSDDQIQRLRSQIDWSGPDARTRASELMRRMLFEYIQAYKAAGNAALMEYRASKRAVRVIDELRLLVNSSSDLLASAPAFGEYLIEDKGDLLLDTEEFIYWSKEQFGLKPVISVTHVIIHHPGHSAAPDVLIASKQIYASRYIVGSLALTAAMNVASEAPGGSFYMIYSNRTRPAASPAVIGGLVRRVAHSRSRTGMEENLGLTRQRLEASYRKMHESEPSAQF